MSDQDHSVKIRSVRLDPLFYDSSTGKPFTRCKVCDKNILEDPHGYMIEKAVKQYKEYTATDIIFEYALCMFCYEQISENMSALSKQRISEYYQTHVNFEARRQKLTSEGQPALDGWLNACLIKGTKKEKLSEYQVICQCRGEHIILFNLPILVGNTAMDEMMQLLSEKTLGEMRDFRDKFLGVPPEFKDLFDDRRILIL